MSTILDSLKKSSDQRDDNNQSSINSFTFGRNKKPSKSNLLVILALAAITIAILYFGYQYLYTETENNTKATEAITEVIKPTEDNTSSMKKSVLQEANISKKQRPDNKSVKQELKTKQKLKNKSRNNSKPKNKKTPKPNIRKNSTSKKKSKPIKELKIEKPKYLYVYQLPFSIRKEIPKFKLNIHVYDKNPENRIAVINGARFMIDDMIDEIVLVKDIVSEGVLLEFNQQEFLIPKL